MADRLSKVVGTLKRSPGDRKQRPGSGRKGGSQSNSRSGRYKTIHVRGDAGYSASSTTIKMGGSTRKHFDPKRTSIFTVEGFDLEGFQRVHSSTSVADQHRTSSVSLKPYRTQSFHFKMVAVHKQLVIETDQATSSNEPGQYKFKHSTELSSGQLVSCLCLLPEKTGSDQRLISGSWDYTLTVWNDNDENGLTMERQFVLSNTVLSVSCHSKFIATGSTSIQLYDNESFELRQTLTDSLHDDESTEDPPLHLVAYTPDGDLVSASVENNVVKVWPLASLGTMVQPKACFVMEEKEEDQGCNYRLVLCPSAPELWLAVVVQPGKLFFPSGSKKIHLYSLKDEKFCNIIDAEHGGIEVGVQVTFSPDGRFLYTGCKDEIIKWENPSGKLTMRISLDKDEEVTCLTFSPDGVHLAVGLLSGDVAMLDGCKGDILFILRESNWKNRSAVTSMAYSRDSSILATGHEKGSIYLWTRIREEKTTE